MTADIATITMARALLRDGLDPDIFLCLHALANEVERLQARIAALEEQVSIMGDLPIMLDPAGGLKVADQSQRIATLEAALHEARRRIANVVAWARPTPNEHTLDGYLDDIDAALAPDVKETP